MVGEMPRNPLRRLWKRVNVSYAVAIGCLAVAGYACFGNALLGNQQFGFRDAAHFYYPLHQRIQQEWQAGRWPLWAPEENAGMPLLGNPAAAVLYPGKVVFFFLPYPWAARLYVVSHVLIASLAMWAMLRAWRISTTGAAIGALSYAFGAPVLSLTSNVVFLVGAAWAPLGFLAADRWIRLHRRGGIAGLAMVLALQILGGDPQAAYITVVCSLGYAAALAARPTPAASDHGRWRALAGVIIVYCALVGLSWWSTRAAVAALGVEAKRNALPAPPTGVLVFGVWAIAALLVIRQTIKRRASDSFGRVLGGVFGASALALAVTGAQLLPALEFVGLSTRAAESQPLYDVYRFSVHPFQLFDLVWPDYYGTLDRGNRSWAAALPATRDSQLWVPSLYLGALPLVLALSAAGARGGAPWRRWLTWVAAASLAAALGAYASPLFWARLVPGVSSVLGPVELPAVPRIRTDGYLRDGDGGPYWLLASALPGFRAFRYPGKFVAFAALAMSGLAGIGWDQLAARGPRRAARLAAAFLMAGAIATVGVFCCRAAVRERLEAVADRVRSFRGPLDAPGAIVDLHRALAQGSIGFATMLGLLALARRQPNWAGIAALAAITLDLASANARHVITVPQAAFDEVPKAAQAIQDAERMNPTPGPFRVQRVGSWAPTDWFNHGARDRFEQVVRWERDTLRPSYGMPLGESSTFALGTAEVLDYGLFFAPSLIALERPSAAALGLQANQKVLYYPRRGFDLWTTRYFIVPDALEWDSPERGYASFLPRTSPVDPAPRLGGRSARDAGRARSSAASEDTRILRNEAAFPRAWVVHRARLLPPLRGMRQADRRASMQELLFQNDELWHDDARRVYDPHTMAWVETDDPQSVSRFLSGAEPDASEAVSITHYDPQHVELTAVLRSSGLVVLADVDYPGWTLTVDGTPSEILRTNRAMRGAAVSAGSHRLVFRYRPISFRIGLVVSAVGVVILGCVAVWTLHGQSRPAVYALRSPPR